jgi:peptidoglycan/xylan/chitin deacetylase (PgdA/CDA1 family)
MPKTDLPFDNLTVIGRVLAASLLAATHVLAWSCSLARSPADTPKARVGDSTVVPVFVYHRVARHAPGQTIGQRLLDVDPGVFQQQMDELARGRHPVVSFSDLIEELEGRRELAAGSVVLTFDDGWKNQYDEAYPILKRHGFTATFFVYTTAIGNGPAFMTWDEVRALQRDGMTIGAHSRTHPVLTRDEISLTDEINGSRADIQRNVGVVPDAFAYPYGSWDIRVVDAVRAAGFRGARALGGGPVNAASDVFAIRSVLATDDMQAFERALAGRTAP